jgi:hypothetical protein
MLIVIVAVFCIMWLPYRTVVVHKIDVNASLNLTDIALYNIGLIALLVYTIILQTSQNHTLLIPSLVKELYTTTVEKHLHQFYVIVSIKHFVPLLCKFAARNATLIQ